MSDSTVQVKNVQLDRFRLFMPALFPVLLLLLILFALLFHGADMEKTAEKEIPAEKENAAESLPLPASSSLPDAQTGLVTMEQMSRLSYTDSVLGELKWDVSEESVQELNRVLMEYQIVSPEEICQFLAQVTVETGAGQKLTETGDEAYFQSRGYTTGTRGAGYLHITYEYGQMAFATWMMKRNVAELSGIEYKSPAHSGKDEVVAAYYAALQTAANQGVDISLYSRIVYDERSQMATGADYIAQNFAWESAGYYWHISGIGEALSQEPDADNVDVVSERVGGEHWQSRREAYAAFYPILCGTAAEP